MTTTPIQVTTDLSQILERIDRKIDNLQKDVTEIKIEQAEMKGEIKSLAVEMRGEIKSLAVELKGEIKALDAKIESTATELKGEIKTLDAKVDGIGKRLDTQEFINRSVVVGFVLAVLAGITKMFFPRLG